MTDPVEKKNMFSALPESKERIHDEIIQVLAQGQDCRLERIVSFGHSSPEDSWYDQDQDEWVLLVSGKAELEIEGSGLIPMNPGDYVLLPAHCRHRVAWTAAEQPTVWLACFIRK